MSGKIINTYPIIDDRQLLRAEKALENLKEGNIALCMLDRNIRKFGICMIFPRNIF
jgi:hypothetical protein